MRAVVLDAPGRLEVRDVPDPRPGAGEVVVDVAACAVCRTDLQIAAGDLAMRRAPVVLGHQVVGRVSGTGERTGLAWLGGACGRCPACVRGQENLCPDAALTGWTRDGGYAEAVAARRDFLVAVPAAFSDVEAAPLLCAGIIGHRALRLSGIEPGGRLGLYGFGSSAHLAIQVAVSRGCEVAVCTRGGAGRRRALGLGAAWAGGLDERPPWPLDAAVTFAPVGAAIVAALRALRPGGTVAVNAIHLDHVPEFPYELLWGERVVRSVANFTRADAAEFLELAAQVPVKVAAEPFPLDRAGEALERVRSGAVEVSAVLTVG